MATRASVSTVLVRPLTLALKGNAKGLAAFYAATDLTPEIVADDEARVSPSQFCVGWAEAIRWTATPTLALRIAMATRPGLFGVVEYVCLASPTLHDALRHWVRYLGILDDAVEVALVDVGHLVALRVVRESEAPAPASHELCFALLLLRARHLVANPLADVEARFAHRVAKDDVAAYRDFFGGRATFGATHTELVFQKAALDRPLATADPDLHKILVPTAEEKRRRRSSLPLLTEQVRRALQAALSTDDDQLETVAGRLGMTGRSLQRRLRDEGTVFQTVREEVRRELADRYLGQGMSFSEISFMLGFSEPSAFFRAFKRWTGVTPFERRASLAR